MRSMIVVLLLCLAGSMPVFASAPEGGDADGCVVLVLGDSLSAAYGMEQSESWPALLSGRLSEHGYPCRVFNSSITGETTQGGASRLPRLLARQAPEVVVIELGGNDGLRGLPLDVTENNLRTMIQASLDAGAGVLLAGVQLPPNYGPAYTGRFRELYPRLADEFDIALLPFILEGIALEEGMMQDDGIHPTSGAQPRILELVWPRLEPLLP